MCIDVPQNLRAGGIRNETLQAWTAERRTRGSGKLLQVYVCGTPCLCLEASVRRVCSVHVRYGAMPVRAAIDGAQNVAPMPRLGNAMAWNDSYLLVTATVSNSARRITRIKADSQWLRFAP